LQNAVNAKCKQAVIVPFAKLQIAVNANANSKQASSNCTLCLPRTKMANCSHCKCKLAVIVPFAKFAKGNKCKNAKLQAT
jgi:hypothetical protein